MDVCVYVDCGLFSLSMGGRWLGGSFWIYDDDGEVVACQSAGHSLSLSLPHSVSLSHFCRGQLFRFKCDWVVRFESISWPDYTIEPNIHELLMSAEKSEVWKWGVYAFDTGDYVCLGFRSNDICDCSSGTLSVGPNER